MFLTVWRFVVPEKHLAEFIEHYGPHGTWAELFRRDPAFLRTELQREGRDFVTYDYWQSREAYEAFREKYAEEYAELDRRMEHLTEWEMHVLSEEV